MGPSLFRIIRRWKYFFLRCIIFFRSTLLSSKRSASSASEAECYNMSLGAGPLWWSWCPWQGRRGHKSTAFASHFPHRQAPALGCRPAGRHPVRGGATANAAWGIQRGIHSTAWGCWGEVALQTRHRRKYLITNVVCLTDVDSVSFTNTSFIKFNLVMHIFTRDETDDW